jgi:predicted MFS family arabinose efflux permease
MYSLLMDRTQEDLRAAASASQNLVTSAAMAAASAAAGLLIASHGYAALFAVCACLSLAGAVLTCRMASTPSSSAVAEQAAFSPHPH